MLSKIVRTLLYKLDMNKGFAFEAASLPAALRRIARRGMRINTVIDIGASTGQWSEAVMPFFPDADYLLIEAQEVHRPALERFAAQHSRVHYVLKAAGSTGGEILFDADDPFSGQASDVAREGLVKVPVTTVDAEISTRKLKGPFLIKFDVHGYELPILAGATRTLAECSLVIMECYNFKLCDGSLRFHEMCGHMESLGFRVIDISEPLWRLRDEALWQVDFFFVPASREEFKTATYR